MNRVLRPLKDELLQPAGGQWAPGAWTVALHGNDRARDITSMHENYHQKLNEFTLFGFVLESLIAEMKSRTPNADLEQLFNFLISACRITHETFATFLTQLDIRTFEPKQDLSKNVEYLSYFQLGLQIGSRLPTGRLAALAVSAVARIAMNGPIPEAMKNSRWDEIRGNFFRASQLPDARFQKLITVLDADFWRQLVEELKKGPAGQHPDWDVLITHREQFGVRDLMRFHPLSDGRTVHVVPGAVDTKLELFVDNYIMESVGHAAQEKGIGAWTQQQRRDFEKGFRERHGQVFVRLNDEPADQYHRHRRPFFLERLLLRPAPRPAALSAQGGRPEPAAYSEDINEKLVLIHMRTRAQLSANHEWAGLRPGGADSDLICFYRSGMDSSLAVSLVPDAAAAWRLAVYAGMIEARCAFLISGQLMARDVAADQEWFLHTAATDYLAILLDDDLGKIFQRMPSPPGILVWQMMDLGPHQITMLFLFPLDEAKRGQYGFFRPCSLESLDATLHLLDEAGVPKTWIVMFKHVDPPVQVPPLLITVARRFIDEEYIFVPNSTSIAKIPV